MYVRGRAVLGVAVAVRRDSDMVAGHWRIMNATLVVLNPWHSVELSRLLDAGTAMPLKGSLPTPTAPRRTAVATAAVEHVHTTSHVVLVGLRLDRDRALRC